MLQLWAVERSVGLVEPRRLRRGEAETRPWGGNVSEEPFAQALRDLAVSRGYLLQRSLAIAVGTDQSTVSYWYRGRRVPSPDSFGEILGLLKPNEEERDRLVESYGNLLVEARKRELERRQRELERPHWRPIPEREGRTDFENWLIEFCRKRQIPLRRFFGSIGISAHFRRDLGLSAFARILEETPRVYELDEQEIDSLGEAVGATMEKMMKAGHIFVGNQSPRHIQEQLSCTTYNGQQAAQILGISREMVRQLRKRYDLPLLLTDNDLQMIREKASSRSKIKEDSDGLV